MDTRELALEAIAENMRALRHLAEIENRLWIETSRAILSLDRLARNLGYESAFAVAREQETQETRDLPDPSNGRGPFP